jgi:leucyl-tRNA synthetase
MIGGKLSLIALFILYFDPFMAHGMDNEQQDPQKLQKYDHLTQANIRDFLYIIQRWDDREKDKPISAAMEWLHDATNQNMQLSKKTVEDLLTALSIMIPHFSSELLEQLVGKKLEECHWPTFDPKLALEETITLVVQVNGKMRGNLNIARGSNQQNVEPEAQKLVAKWLENKEIAKVIFVKDRLINFVVSE